MWEITMSDDDRRVYVLDPDEKFERLGNADKKVIYESAVYLREKVERELARTLLPLGELVDSLTDKEWSELPPKVYDFLIQYKHSEED